MRRKNPRLSLSLCCLSVLLLSGINVTVAATSERPPNFVVFFVDDLGYNDVGCFGSKTIKTPHIDRLAAEGMKFTSFYAQPICGPSRAAIMTGSYPMRVAERNNDKNIHPILHAEEITIAEVLKPLGYASAMIGKWDLARHANRNYFEDLLPRGQGFDMHFGTPSSNDSNTKTVLLRDGKVIENPAQQATLTKRYGDEALTFIRKNQAKPFFIYLATNMPHTALHASGDFVGKSKRGLYGDTVEEIDFNIGRVVELLRELKLVENTYVLFTSDNGPWLIKNSEHRQGALPADHGGSALPLRSGKVSTWEGGVRVPTIFWAPGRIPAGKVCDKLAATVDVLPTFAALAGTKPPADRVLDGEDIAHLLQGDFERATPEKTYHYYFRTHLQAVRQGRWKLHLPRPENPPWLKPFSPNRHIAPADDIGFENPLLYDLDADIGETTNVAAMHPDVVARLLHVAEAARTDIGDYDRIGKNQRFFDERPRRPAEKSWLEGR